MNSRVMIPVIWFRLIIVIAFTIFVATQKMWIVAGIAALSVYDPTNADIDAVVSTMRDAARSMRVVRPAAETFDALVVAARRLLAEGGEQVTILSARAVDATALTSKLGVEVMALTAPGIETEIGVE